MLADSRQLLGFFRARALPLQGSPDFSYSTILTFSFTGGFYMLLDPKNAKSRQKAVLLSPVSQSLGCLSLSFHYTLHGQSPGAALTVYASVVGESGEIRGFILTEAHLSGLG